MWRERLCVRVCVCVCVCARACVCTRAVDFYDGASCAAQYSSIAPLKRRKPFCFLRRKARRKKRRKHALASLYPWPLRRCLRLRQCAPGRSQRWWLACVLARLIEAAMNGIVCTVLVRERLVSVDEVLDRINQDFPFGSGLITTHGMRASFSSFGRCVAVRVCCRACRALRVSCHHVFCRALRVCCHHVFCRALRV